jgi:hypothetical protein
MAMKEIGNSIAQLFAIIMILITLAVSTAAVSQWFSTDASAFNKEATLQTQPLLASGAR